MGKILKSCAFALAGLLLSSGIAAAEQPAVTLLSPFGANLNYTCPFFADMLSERLGVKVEYKEDASLGNVTEFMCTKAPKDGSYVMFGGFGPTVLDGWLETQAHDPREQLRFVGQLSWMPIVMYAAKDAPFDDIYSFIEYAKQNPGMTIGIGRPRGGSPEPSTALFAKLAGIDVKFSNQTVNDLGKNGLMVIAHHFFDQHHQAVLKGSAKPLAVYAPWRLANYPDVPTLSELGFPMTYTSWRIVAVPKGISEEAFQKISAAVESIAKDPQFHAVLRHTGEIPYWRGEEATTNWIRAQHASYGKLIDYVGLAKFRDKM